MYWKVEWEFPDNDDSEIFTDEGFAMDCYDECVADGATWVRMTQYEEYCGHLVNEKVLEEYSKEDK